MSPVSVATRRRSHQVHPELDRLEHGPINHLKRNDSLGRNRILDEYQRIEPGIDGLARTNLRFS